MICSKKWYGATARTAEEYFYNNCKTYEDIANVVDRKGIRALRELTPSIESFIENNSQVMPEAVTSKFISNGDCYSKSIAKVAIKHAINNCAALESVDSGELWTMWLNIPEIERMYRLGKVNESAKEILNSSLKSFADRVVGNLSTMSSDAVASAVENFANCVDYKTMIKWESARESIMNKNPKAAYVGDMINNVTENDWAELANEGAMSEIDMTLDGIAKRMKRRDSNTDYATESFRNIVDDMWGYFATLENATDIENELYSYYYMKDMTVSMEAYSLAMVEMAKAGCLPGDIGEAVESIAMNMYNDWDFSKGTSTRAGNGVSEEDLSLVIESVIENGTIRIDDESSKFLFSTNEQFIAAMESSKEEEKDESKQKSTMDKVADGAKKVKNTVVKTAAKGKSDVNRLFKHYKDNEGKIDQVVSKVSKRATSLVSGDADSMRREIIEGKDYSAMRVLKELIGGYGIFCFSKIGFLVTLITRFSNRGKLRRSEKKKILMELQGELEIVEAKIRDAEQDGNREAKYALIRTKTNIEMGIKRIKSGDEAVGAKDVLSRK